MTELFHRRIFSQLIRNAIKFPFVCRGDPYLYKPVEVYVIFALDNFMTFYYENITFHSDYSWSSNLGSCIYDPVSE